jgi:hypothetical protein
VVLNWLKRFFTKEYACLSIFVLYVPLLFLGFGTDSDTYTALNAWNYFLEHKVYVPSRLPGYVIHEIGIYYATKIGGSLLSNFVTLLFAVISCVVLLKIAKSYSIPKSAILLVILNPVFIVNSTSTVDYIWAMCFFLVGFYLMRRKRIIWGCLALALSSGIRLSYAFMILAVFVYFFIQYVKENNKYFVSFLIGGLFVLAVNFAAYCLPLNFAHWKLSVFLNASLGDESMWSPFMRIGRWGYKNLLLFGIPSTLLILSLFFYKVKFQFKKGFPADKDIIGISLLLILIVELVFLKYPIEIEYLLPILPLLGLILGVFFREKPWIISVVSLCILVNGFFAISIARPDIPNHATSAEFRITSTQGYIFSDIINRPIFEEKFHNLKNWWYIDQNELPEQ